LTEIRDYLEWVSKVMGRQKNIFKELIIRLGFVASRDEEKLPK